MKSVSRFIALMAVALAALTIASTAPASAAASTARPATAVVSNSSSSHVIPNSTTPAHSCVTLAENSSWQAVLCADVVNTTGATVTAQAEIICNSRTNGNVYEACASAGANIALYSTVGQLTPEVGYDCDGNCYASGRNYWYSGDTFTPPVGCYNVWTVVFAGAWITLPGGASGSLSSNLGSGHINICD